MNEVAEPAGTRRRISHSQWVTPDELREYHRELGVWNSFQKRDAPKILLWNCIYDTIKTSIRHEWRNPSAEGLLNAVNSSLTEFRSLEDPKGNIRNPSKFMAFGQEIKRRRKRVEARAENYVKYLVFGPLGSTSTVSWKKLPNDWYLSEQFESYQGTKGKLSALIEITNGLDQSAYGRTFLAKIFAQQGSPVNPLTILEDLGKRKKLGGDVAELLSSFLVNMTPGLIYYYATTDDDSAVKLIGEYLLAILSTFHTDDAIRKHFPELNTTALVSDDTTEVAIATGKFGSSLTQTAIKVLEEHTVLQERFANPRASALISTVLSLGGLLAALVSEKEGVEGPDVAKAYNTFVHLDELLYIHMGGKLLGIFKFVVSAVAGTLDIIWNVFDGVKAWKIGDWDAAAGNLFSALGAASTLIVEMLSISGVAASVSPHIAALGLALALVGTIVLFLGKDSEIETWLLHCYFGKNWESGDFNDPSLPFYRWKIKKGRGARINYGRQTAHYFSLLTPIEIKDCLVMTQNSYSKEPNRVLPTPPSNFSLSPVNGVISLIPSKVLDASSILKIRPVIKKNGTYEVGSHQHVIHLVEPFQIPGRGGETGLDQALGPSKTSIAQGVEFERDYVIDDEKVSLWYGWFGVTQNRVGRIFGIPPDKLEGSYVEIEVIERKSKPFLGPQLADGSGPIRPDLLAKVRDEEALATVLRARVKVEDLR